jgi:hypothetical protein
VIAGSLVAFPVRAEDAETLVQQGLSLRREKHDQEALVLFRAAYAKQPTPRVRAQIALAEQAIGHYVEAEADLRAALAASGDPWIQKNAQGLSEALETLEEHLGWLEVQGSAGASVRVNGANTGTLPLAKPVRVVAGTVHVEAEIEGRRATQTVTVAPRKRVAVMITVPPAPPKQPVVDTSAPPLERSRLESYVGMGLLGAGVASLTAGAYFGVRVGQLRETRNEHCDDSGCDPTGLASDHEARDAARFSTFALVFGGVTAVTGVALVLHDTFKANGPTVGLVVTGAVARLSIGYQF